MKKITSILLVMFITISVTVVKTEARARNLTAQLYSHTETMNVGDTMTFETGLLDYISSDGVSWRATSWGVRVDDAVKNCFEFKWDFDRRNSLVITALRPTGGEVVLRPWGHYEYQIYNGGANRFESETGVLETSIRITITDPNPPTSVTLPASTSINEGESRTLTPVCLPAQATPAYTWTTSNASVVSVDSRTGSIKGVGGGTATVTATTHNGLSASTQVTVIPIPDPTGIVIEPVSKGIIIGNSMSLNATVEPAGSFNKLVWTSSDSSVAAVNSSSGKITAKKEGTATITATARNGVSASIQVTVVPIPVPKEIKISAEKTELNPDEQITLSATILPEGTGSSISWSTSDEDIATVSRKGVVTAYDKQGTVTITAETDNGVKSEIKLKVKIPGPDKISASLPEYVIVGQEYQIAVESFPKDEPVKLTYSNKLKCSVSNDGVFKANRSGWGEFDVRAQNGVEDWVYFCALAPLTSDDVEIDKNGYITDYTGDYECIYIPASIDGKKINGLGKDLFQFNDEIEIVVLEEGIKEIEKYCFAECDSLEMISLPQSIISIGKYAFSECSSLYEITIPGNVKEISESVFYDCENLENVRLEEGIEKIGHSAFVKAGITVIKLPESVNEIDENSFGRCRNLKMIILPKNVESIGPYFLKHTAVEKIIIPASVKELSPYAFCLCKNLTDIYFTGTEEEWKTLTYFDQTELVIEDDRYLERSENFRNATIHYNYKYPSDDIKININGVFLLPDQAPVIKDDRTLVPLRAISEAFGTNVSWEADTRTAVIVKDDDRFELTIDKKIMVKRHYLDITEYTLDVPAQVINDRTMVPIRAISKVLDAEVSWDGDSKTVFIVTE